MNRPAYMCNKALCWMDSQVLPLAKFWGKMEWLRHVLTMMSMRHCDHNDVAHFLLTYIIVCSGQSIVQRIQRTRNPRWPKIQLHLNTVFQSPLPFFSKILNFNWAIANENVLCGCCSQIPQWKLISIQSRSHSSPSNTRSSFSFWSSSCSEVPESQVS